MLLITALLSGCESFQPWSKISQPEFEDRSRGFKTTVPVGWMRHNPNKDYFITNDGEILDNITVKKIKFDTALENTKRRFLPEMTPEELADVRLDIAKSNPGINNVTVMSNSPAVIDGQNAFLLEFTFINKMGLKYHAHCSGFAFNNYVYLINFEATDQHYYAKTHEAFNTFLKNFKLIK